jgi:hypothetical protein
MIKEVNLNIGITTRNISFYINKGYDNLLIGNNYNIKIEDINRNSKCKITAICELCKSENVIGLDKYYKNKSNHNFYSCKKCSRNKFILTNNIKFGVDNPMQNLDIKNKVKYNNIQKYGVSTTLLEEETIVKIRKTNMDKYGHENHLKSEYVRDKIKKSMLEKYDVEYPLQSDEIKIKQKNTNLKKYGVDNPNKIKEVRDKIKNTNLQRYGNISPLKSELVISKLNEKYKIKYSNINIVNIENKLLSIVCKDCNKLYNISKTLFNHKLSENVNLCPICNPSTNSNKEIKLLEFISDNYNGTIIPNDKSVLNPYELDIYLPDLNLAFEYNGVYWHNEMNKNDNYHLDKTEKCENRGIQLIHIWEDDWIYKQSIVKSMILNKLGKTENKIYARKTIIKEIDDNFLIKEFLEKNHIQGYIGSKIKLGLFYNDELVSLMLFGGLRASLGSKSKENSYELLRFCNKLDVHVIGGASKILNYFLQQYNPIEIITYADRAYSRGHLYYKLGFKYNGNTKPNYYYVINKNRCNRFNFRKDVLIKEGFDPNKTEHQIMLERKIYRIYDSGSLRFVFKN